MNKHIVMVITALCLTAAACGGDLVNDPPGPGGPGGGAPRFCPDAADAYAVANGLALPYPANPANPTPYDPSLPPPAYYHPCLNGAGAQTYRSGAPCYICTDGTNQYPDLLPGSLPCTDSMAGLPVVCIGSYGGNVNVCDPGAQGCS